MSLKYEPSSEPLHIRSRSYSFGVRGSGCRSPLIRTWKSALVLSRSPPPHPESPPLGQPSRTVLCIPHGSCLAPVPRTAPVPRPFCRIRRPGTKQRAWGLTDRGWLGSRHGPGAVGPARPAHGTKCSHLGMASVDSPILNLALRHAAPQGLPRPLISTGNEKWG